MRKHEHNSRGWADGAEDSCDSVVAESVDTFTGEEVNDMACTFTCAWCKEARVNQYSTHNCSHIPAHGG